MARRILSRSVTGSIGGALSAEPRRYGVAGTKIAGTIGEPELDAMFRPVAGALGKTVVLDRVRAVDAAVGEIRELPVAAVCSCTRRREKCKPTKRATPIKTRLRAITRLFIV